MKKLLVLGVILFVAFPVLLWANGSKEYQITDLLPVDDFESGNDAGTLKEKWTAYNDGYLGGRSTTELKINETPGYADSNYCLHLTWKMDMTKDIVYAGVARILNSNDEGIDLTGYYGIRFFAKGNGSVNVHLALPPGKKEFNYHRTIDLPLYPEWQVYEIPFSQFQVRWGSYYKWDPSNVLYLEWEHSTKAPREGEIYIDDISFYKVKEKEGEKQVAATVKKNTIETNKKKDVQPEPVVSTLKADQAKGKRVAVVGVESKAIDEEVAKAMVDFIVNAYVNNGSLKVVDRNSIEKILDEQTFQAKDFADTEKMIQVGKIAGADFISVGSISKVGKMYYLNVKLISVQTAEIIGSSIATADNDSGFFMMTNEAVSKLFKQ